MITTVDVTDTTDNLALAMDGADVVVAATGFVPKSVQNELPRTHEVDNEGVVNCVKAAKKAGNVKKIVLISSILTNGRAAGLADSPGFKITNAFGGVLDEKLDRRKLLTKQRHRLGHRSTSWVEKRPIWQLNHRPGRRHDVWGNRSTLGRRSHGESRRCGR